MPCFLADLDFAFTLLNQMAVIFNKKAKTKSYDHKDWKTRGSSLVKRCGNPNSGPSVPYFFPLFVSYVMRHLNMFLSFTP